MTMAAEINIAVLGAVDRAAARRKSDDRYAVRES
jgi:hypothetical protein